MKACRNGIIGTINYPFPWMLKFVTAATMKLLFDLMYLQLDRWSYLTTREEFNKAFTGQNCRSWLWLCPGEKMTDSMCPLSTKNLLQEKMAGKGVGRSLKSMGSR